MAVYEDEPIGRGRLDGKTIQSSQIYLDFLGRRRGDPELSKEVAKRRMTDVNPMGAGRDLALVLLVCRFCDDGTSDTNRTPGSNLNADRSRTR